MRVSFLQIRSGLFYLFVFLLPWQTRWIVRDPHIGWLKVPSGVEGVWEYGRVSLYGWDIVLFALVLVSWTLVRREIKNFKFQISNFKSNPNELESQITNHKSRIYKFSILNSLFLIRNSGQFIFLLAFLCLSFLSIIWSNDKVLAVAWSLRLLEGGLLWLLIKSLKPKLSFICWSMVWAGAIQAIWGTVQFFTQTTFANKWLGVAVHPFTQSGSSVILASGEKWLRAYGGQVHPNVLGGLLVVTLLATVWLFVVDINAKNPKFQTPNSKIKRLNWSLGFGHWEFNNNSYSLLLLYAIQLVGLFFTFSRGAWLALGVSLIIWWWQRAEISRSILIITALIFLILSAIYFPLVQARVFGIGNLEQQSIEERVGSVKDSRSILSRVWWYGTGIGNYTVELQKIQPGLATRFYQPVHNVFLLIFSELGVVGLLLFVLLILSVCYPLRATHYVLIAVLITALFDHHWWTIPSMFLLFWFIVSIINKDIYD